MDDNSLDRKTIYQIAYEMYKQEHTRWNQNSLLFLGVVASLLYSIQYLKDTIEPGTVLLVATLVTIYWLAAILCNRSTTDAWMETLKTIEHDQSIDKPFTLFENRRESFSLWKDLLSNFGLTHDNRNHPRSLSVFKNVTRIYQLLAMTLIIGFGLMTYFSFTKSPSTDSAKWLGTHIIESEIRRLFPDATVVDVPGKRTISNSEFIFQVRIARQTGRQLLVNWHLDAENNVISGPDTLTTP